MIFCALWLWYFLLKNLVQALSFYSIVLFSSLSIFEYFIIVRLSWLSIVSQLPMILSFASDQISSDNLFYLSSQDQGLSLEKIQQNFQNIITFKHLWDNPKGPCKIATICYFALLKGEMLDIIRFVWHALYFLTRSALL